jgi:Mn2+/Fe2+ NRAMP family transporter
MGRAGFEPATDGFMRQLWRLRWTRLIADLALDAVRPGSWAFVRAAAAALVVAEGVDRLALVHLRAALDPDLLGPPLEVVLALVLVAAGLAAAVAGLRAGVLAMRAAFSFDSPFSRSFSYCRSSFTLGP